MSLDELLAQELADLDAQGLLRSLRLVGSPQGAVIELDGRKVTNFSSNAAGDGGDRLRATLHAHAALLRDGLAERGLLAPGAGTTPIFPIAIGDERRALAATQALLAEGIYAQAIRPPTVPPGTARLRISVMATHTTEHIAALLAALDRLGLGRRR